MGVAEDAIALLDPIFEERVYSDEVPPGGLKFPYAGILDNITETARMRGDAAMMASARTVQIDVWQKLEEESDEWPDRVVDALDGTKVTAGFRFVWLATSRIPDTEADIAHHAITFSITRLRQTF